MSSSRLERLFESGMTALRKQRYNQACDAFSEAMEFAPELPEIHYNRGLACAGLLRWEDAAECFRLALRLRPDAEYWLHLGLTRLHLRQWREALEDFTQALRLDPGAELAALHRRDLEAFFAAGGAAGPAAAAHPSLCGGWFHPRLEDFVGVDPEIVTKEERVELRAYLRRALAEEQGGCDHSQGLTEEWALRTGRDPLGVCRFLFGRGLRCDCAVIAEPEKKAAPRPLSGGIGGGASAGD